MIIIKLKTPVQKLYQEGLNTATVTAEYITSTLEDYQLGQPKLNFYYKIGKVEFDQYGFPKTFIKVFSGYEAIPSEDLQNWGSDDFVALEILASKLGLEIDESPDSKINAPYIHFKS